MFISPHIQAFMSILMNLHISYEYSSCFPSLFFLHVGLSFFLGFLFCILTYTYLSLNWLLQYFYGTNIVFFKKVPCFSLHQVLTLCPCFWNSAQYPFHNGHGSPTLITTLCSSPALITTLCHVVSLFLTKNICSSFFFFSLFSRLNHSSL